MKKKERNYIDSPDRGLRVARCGRNHQGARPHRQTKVTRPLAANMWRTTTIILAVTVLMPACTPWDRESANNETRSVAITAQGLSVDFKLPNFDYRGINRIFMKWESVSGEVNTVSFERRSSSISGWGAEIPGRGSFDCDLPPRHFKKDWLRGGIYFGQAVIPEVLAKPVPDLSSAGSTCWYLWTALNNPHGWAIDLKNPDVAILRMPEGVEERKLMSHIEEDFGDMLILAVGDRTTLIKDRDVASYSPRSREIVRVETEILDGVGKPWGLRTVSIFAEPYRA